MLNAIFVALILASVLWAAWNGTMPEMTAASSKAAKTAVVDVLFPLVGVMALWLGLMRVLRDAGAMATIARWMAPVMNRLFPEIPKDHPAMGAMIMNISANMLGLGNAATPFGLKAMQELNTLNMRPGVATNSMALFLAINTSGVAVIPTGMIAFRGSQGSLDPAGILLPSILATACSTVVGFLVIKLLQNRRGFAVENYPSDPAPEGESIADGIMGLAEAEETAELTRPTSKWGAALFAGFAFALIAILIGRAIPALNGELSGGEMTRFFLSQWLLPVFICLILLIGVMKGVRVYDSMIKGAREGFDLFVMILPFVVAILTAVGLVRASGLLSAAAGWLSAWVAVPIETIMMAIVRPLSGSGAFGVVADTFATLGPDSFAGFMVSVQNGSTESTFYVMAVYLGSVRIRAARHALPACLAADATAFFAAWFWCRMFFA